MPFPGTRFLNSASFLSVGSLAVVSAGGRTHMGLVEAIRQSRLDRNSSSTRTSRLAYTGLPFPPPDHPFEGYRQDAPCKSASQGALSRRTQNDNRHARSRPRLEPLDARGARLRSSSTVRHVTSLGGGLSTVVSVCSTACVTLATLSVGRRTSAGTCPRSASVPPHPFRPLAPGPQPGFDSCGEGVGALFCEECGCCCGELGTGLGGLRVQRPRRDRGATPRRLLPTLRRGRVRLPTRQRGQLRLRLGATPPGQPPDASTDAL
jgi:hypothetical protein